MDKRMETGREGCGCGRILAAGPGPGAAAEAAGGTAASALDAAIKAALAGDPSLEEVEEELERRARRGASAFPRAPLPAGIH